MGKIGTGNQQAIEALVRILETTKDEYTRWSAAESLGKIGTGNQQAIEPLVRILEMHEHTRRRAAESLGEIGTGNQQAIEALVRILETTEDKDTRRRAAYSLGKIGTGNPQAIEALVRILETTEHKDTRSRAAYSLGKIDPGNPQAIEALVRILETTKAVAIRRRAAESLGKIGTGNPQAIEALVRILETAKNEDNRRRAAESLGEIGTGNPQAIEALIRILATTKNEDTRRRAAESLGKIGTGNQQAIEALARILATTKDEDTRRGAASFLGRIMQNNQMPLVVSALQHCLTNEVYQTNFDLYSNCYNLIWRCAQNMTYPAFYQAWHPQEGVGKTSTSGSQSLNEADLPQRLHTAIANDRQLSQTIHLICIDGSQFIEPNNPAAEIYDQMLDENCPECDKVPETMPALKLYWNSLKRNSNKHPVCVFYASSTEPYSEAFLRDLSKFKGDIGVVTSPPTPLLQGEESKSSSGSPSSSQGEGVRGWGSLQLFTPSQPIADVVEWIRAIAFS